MTEPTEEDKKRAEQYADDFRNTAYSPEQWQVAHRAYLAACAEKNEEKSKIKQHLENRIAELYQADAAFCKDRWDMTKSQMERSVARGFSNEVTFARQELQSILRLINT